MFLKPPQDDSALYWYEVDVERCVDGDTFVASLSFGFGLLRKKQYFRLALIDTPERGQLGFDEATEFLKSRIDGKRILINSARDTSGRYKRIVCQIFVDGENVNRQLLEAGHAKLVNY